MVARDESFRMQRMFGMQNYSSLFLSYWGLLNFTDVIQIIKPKLEKK